jgi:hypothetical protein
MNFEDIQVKNETVFEGNQMETENDMENQEIDIENGHETTSAAHNMEFLSAFLFLCRRA